MRPLLSVVLLALLPLAGCGEGAGGVGPGDAGSDAAADAPADVTPVCTFTGGIAPATGAATTFPCALAPTAAPWGDCPARFPAPGDEIALLCRRPFETGPQPAAAPAAPEAVLAGTCGGQQVVVLNVSPGHGIECHYSNGGDLVGVAFYDAAPSYCGSTSAAMAAGLVTHAPCLLDMDATWDSVSCDSAPPLSPVCGSP
jgi:hypothetical protein